MPTKQITQECRTSQDGSNDDCKGKNPEDKDGEEHRAAQIVPNSHEDEAADDRNDCEENETRGCRCKMQKEKR